MVGGFAIGIHSSPAEVRGPPRRPALIRRQRPGIARSLGLGLLVCALVVGIWPVFPLGTPSPVAVPPGGPGAGSATAPRLPAVGNAQPAPVARDLFACHGLRDLGTPACGGSTERAGGVVTFAGTEIVPPAHVAYDFELAYDSGDGYAVLLGAVAEPAGGIGPTDMWSFHDGDWSPITPTLLPENCVGSSLVYDDSDGYLLYFGGLYVTPTTPCSSAGQTWAYHGGTWWQLHPSTSPSTRYGAALTNDTADGVVLLFGGLAASCGSREMCNDTWTFTGGQWTQLHPEPAPTPREEAGLAYDAADGYALLFGGVGDGVTSAPWLNDTWTFHAGHWTQLHPEPAPPWPYPDALSYDAADAGVVYTSAWDAVNISGSVQEMTWLYHAGSWTHITSPAPIERLGVGMTFDYSDGYLLFFGGLGVPAPLQDTWGFQGGTWTNLTRPVAAVSATSLTISPSPSRVGVLTTFFVSATGGAPPYSYTYSGLPAGCPGADVSSFQCPPSGYGRTTVVVGIRDAWGTSVSVQADLTVLPPLLVVGSLVADPSPVAAGDPVTFSMSISGGAAPFSFAYFGLPGGCVDTNSSALTCRPLALGTFQVTSQVIDDFGQSANATGTVVVLPQGSSGTPNSSGPEILGVPAGEAYALVAIAATLGAALVVVLLLPRRPP